MAANCISAKKHKTAYFPSRTLGKKHKVFALLKVIAK